MRSVAFECLPSLPFFDKANTKSDQTKCHTCLNDGADSWLLCNVPRSNPRSSGLTPTKWNSAPGCALLTSPAGGLLTSAGSTLTVALVAVTLDRPPASVVTSPVTQQRRGLRGLDAAARGDAGSESDVSENRPAQ